MDDVAYLVSKQSPEVAAPYNWFGFRSEMEFVRHIEEDGFLGDLYGKLIVEVDTPNGPVPIGDVSWHTVDYGPPPASQAWNIGITLSPEWRRQGLGTRAQRLLADYLFETTRAERVEASTDVDNVAERRSLDKAGFTFEGILRRAQFRGGAWRDMALYSLVGANRALCRDNCRTRLAHSRRTSVRNVRSPRGAVREERPHDVDLDDRHPGGADLPRAVLPAGAARPGGAALRVPADAGGGRRGLRAERGGAGAGPPGPGRHRRRPGGRRILGRAGRRPHLWLVEGR